MFYVILISVVLVALFLIFRDDHDKSYNKNEHSAPRPPQHKPEPPSSVFPSIKQSVQYAQDVVEEFEKDVEERGEYGNEEEEQDEEKIHLDLSFLLSLDYDEDLDENTETFDITGLRYHCTAEDCGPIVGYVQPDPSNVHDSRAQAVIRADGKLMGYIPRTQLDDYEDFNEDDVVCPFVGEIELDDRGWLIGEIKVIIPTSIEFVRNEIEDGL